jgi:hypothetical protein
MKRLSSILAVAALAATSAFASVTVTLSDQTAAELRSVLGSAPVVVQPPVVQPPAPVAVATTIRASSLTADDKMYIYKNISPYASALKSLPGSHQIFFDLLTDNSGKTYWQLVEGSAAQAALKLQINTIINDTSYNLPWASFDVNAYKGPVRAILANLIAAKLAGK